MTRFEVWGALAHLFWALVVHDNSKVAREQPDSVVVNRVKRDRGLVHPLVL